MARNINLSARSLLLLLLCLFPSAIAQQNSDADITSTAKSVKNEMSYEFASLLVAIASLATSVAATLIAKSSLAQTKRVADRDHRDWRQRKWFDLYFKANEVYDRLDRFRILSASWDQQNWEREWNDLMRVIRGAHAMADVFPSNPAINEFFSRTAIFKDEKTVSEDCLSKVFDAVELIREQALVDGTVLE